MTGDIALANDTNQCVSSSTSIDAAVTSDDDDDDTADRDTPSILVAGTGTLVNNGTSLLDDALTNWIDCVSVDVLLIAFKNNEHELHGTNTLCSALYAALSTL